VIPGCGEVHLIGGFDPAGGRGLRGLAARRQRLPESLAFCSRRGQACLILGLFSSQPLGAAPLDLSLRCGNGRQARPRRRASSAGISAARRSSALSGLLGASQQLGHFLLQLLFPTGWPVRVRGRCDARRWHAPWCHPGRSCRASRASVCRRDRVATCTNRRCSSPRNRRRKAHRVSWSGWVLAAMKRKGDRVVARPARSCGSNRSPSHSRRASSGEHLRVVGLRAEARGTAGVRERNPAARRSPPRNAPGDRPAATHPRTGGSRYAVPRSTARKLLIESILSGYFCLENPITIAALSPTGC